MNDPVTIDACRRLLAAIGLPDRPALQHLTVTGADPVIRSRLRYGAATAAALAAQGLAIAAIWAQRTGRWQSVSVDLARSVHLGLRTTLNLRQNGHGFDVGSRSRASNFFLTRDQRHIYLLRNNGRGTITEDLIGLLRAPNSTEGIAAAVSTWQSTDLEEALAAAKLPGVIARTAQEWREHPQGRLLAAEPAFGLHRIGASAPEPLRAAERPLAGMRVLDVSHVIAGPAAGRLLAEQGAEVLHISRPGERETQQIIMDLGFGKRDAYLDLDRPEDRAQLARLAERADVFIDSWRPGALARRGFSPAELAKLRPGIVHLSISCYGDRGPWATRGGYEPIGQAVSGLSIREGWPGPPRNAPTVTMNDYLAAYLGCVGVLGALLRRAREGGSWHVTTSLAQASMWVLEMGELPAIPESVPHFAPAHADLGEAQGSFGRLLHVAPLTRYGETPGYWERCAEPAGASLPLWRS
jgi:crotonobetainyl-CoA:carnitine CoA-transferase CaiB-like acyl-CoA transferase